MIPQTFHDWKKCITQDCKIDLTKAYAQKRLTVYLNKDSDETKKFLALYGEQHLNNIINWFKQI